MTFCVQLNYGDLLVEPNHLIVVLHQWSPWLLDHEWSPTAANEQGQEHCPWISQALVVSVVWAGLVSGCLRSNWDIWKPSFFHVRKSCHFGRQKCKDPQNEIFGLKLKYSHFVCLFGVSNTFMAPIVHAPKKKLTVKNLGVNTLFRVYSCKGFPQALSQKVGKLFAL